MVGCVVREVVSLWVVGGSWGSGDKPIVRNDFLFRGKKNERVKEAFGPVNFKGPNNKESTKSEFYTLSGPQRDIGARTYVENALMVGFALMSGPLERPRCSDIRVECTNGRFYTYVRAPKIKGVLGLGLGLGLGARGSGLGLGLGLGARAGRCLLLYC